MPFFLHLGRKQQVGSLKQHCRGFAADTVAKNPPANAADAEDGGLTPGWGSSPGGGNSNPLQYPCLGNPMVGGAWRLQSMGLQRVRHDRVAKHTHCIASSDLLRKVRVLPSARLRTLVMTLGLPWESKLTSLVWRQLVTNLRTGCWFYSPGPGGIA